MQGGSTLSPRGSGAAAARPPRSPHGSGGPTRMAAAAAAAVEKAAAADRAEAARSQAEPGSQEGVASQPSAGDGTSDGSGTVRQQQWGLETASDGAVPPANEHVHLQLPGSELQKEACAGPDLVAPAASSVTEPPQAPLSAAAVSTQQMPVQQIGTLHAEGAEPQQQPPAVAAAAPALGQQRSGNPFADPLPAAVLEARPSGNPFAGGSALDTPAGSSEGSRAAWLANLAALAEVTQAAEARHQQQARTIPGRSTAQPQADELGGSQGPGALLPAAAAAAETQETAPPAAGLSHAEGNAQQPRGAPAGRATLQTSEGTRPVPGPAATAAAQGTGEGRLQREQAAFPKPPIWADTAPTAAHGRAGGLASEKPAAAVVQAASAPYPAPKSVQAGTPRAASPALESRKEPPGVLHAPFHEEHRAAGTQHAGAASDHTQALLQQAAWQQAPPAGAGDDSMQELQVERLQQHVQPGGQARHPPALPDPMQALLEERLQQRAETQAQSGQRSLPPDPRQALLEERQQQLLRQPGAAQAPAAEGSAPDEVPAAELQAWVAAERQQREAEGLQAADEHLSAAEHVAVSRSADLGAASGLHREPGLQEFML